MPDVPIPDELLKKIDEANHCPLCGAEYRNIQHPLKPPGVIIQRLCDCTPVTTTVQVGANAICTTVMVPPGKSDDRR
jgi:predicted transcriptional regulator